MTSQTTDRSEVNAVIEQPRNRCGRHLAERACVALARKQTAVAELGQRALSGAALSTLMDDAAAKVAEALEVEFSKILELLPGGDALILRAGVGWKDGLVGHATVGAGTDSQAGYTLLANEPVVVTDLAADTRFSGPPLLREHRVVSGLSTIIGGASGRFGVLGAHTTKRRDFTADDVNFLQSIANVVATAIERGRTLAQVEDQARLLDLAQDAIIVRGFDDRTITFWNRGAERLYGWTMDEAVGCEAASLIFAVPSEVDAISRRLLKTSEWRGELRQVTKDGGEIVVDGRATLLRAEDGSPKSVLIINSDITERKKIEAQFLRAQRMESIGRLASGIAHDLNNILAPILMGAPLLRNAGSSDSAVRIVDTIEASAQRGADIVRQVLTFARGVEGERILLQPHHLIREMEKIACETFPKSIAIRNSAPHELWTLIGDATQLHQVLLNLCVNARDAMPEGGTLTFDAQNFDLDEQCASMMPGAQPGPHVVLKVSDSGAGIPRSVLDKIFDPFFTTKEIGKGTGLGLSTVLGIVKSHGGFVNVYSEVGKGTTFKVFVPATPDASAENAAAAQTPAPRGNGELILVVDDEASIRTVSELILGQHGYRVISAADGTEALAIFAQQRRAIAAVLTDVMMPHMDGIVLARALRRFDPNVVVIGSTGRCEEDRLAEMESLGMSGFLTKPYNTHKLLTVLRDALGARP